MEEQVTIFALDVGTRSVVGLVLERLGTGYRVKAAEIDEHQQRAMMDGQIHDIPLVAEVVSRIKTKLEKRLGHPLREVAVAAAGRTLQTARGTADRDISVLAEVSPEDVIGLQAESVQQAQRTIMTKGEDLHCVGYSVVASKLDGSLIGNLVGQRGSRMEVEVIATFLPRVVVDSLQAVLQRSGLEMQSLTLEPIAAINVAIPANMRQLNLVLVDVGAGTSDIAITAGGTVTGYAMVPAAGDEVTEQICARLLVDFAVGEVIKRQLNEKEIVEFTDVVGVKQRVRSCEIIEDMMPVVDDLARQVAEKIILLNGKPPQAVICIGGGSLTPGLTGRLASHLGLPENRVAVRGREVVQDVTGGPKSLSGPQSITPIGIAVTALSHKSLGFIRVWVNDRQVRLLKLKNPTIADALLASGVSIRKLYGRPGPALSVEVNGKVVFLRGTAGIPAQITLNGGAASVDSPVTGEDRIEVRFATDGKPGHGTIADVVPVTPGKTVIVNGKEYRLDPRIIMNNQEVNRDTLLIDGAVIRHWSYQTVAEVLEYLGYSRDPTPRVLLNGVQVDGNATIKDGDLINVDSTSSGVTTIVLNGEPLHLPAGPGSTVILSDLFRFIDIDVKKVAEKKRFTMEVNGSKANFTTPIAPNDHVNLKWE